MKVIYQYDRSGILLRVHFGEQAASESIGVSVKELIDECCTNGKELKGFFWRPRKTNVFKSKTSFAVFGNKSKICPCCKQLKIQYNA